MLNRTQQNDQLSTVFSILSTTITIKSKQSMFDDNRVLETILPTLLNNLYGLSLVDLNVGKYNHPAIDLGDKSRGKAIQISADGSKDKMEDTISMLEKHGLNKVYKDITFLIISDSPKQTFQRKGYEIHIKNFADIVRDITSLPTAKFDEIYHFCKNQFSSYFPNNSESIFKPINIPSKDPHLSISNFMDRNGFFEPYDINVDDVRRGLIALKEKLSSLNEDQRWFLYKIMDWAIKYGEDKYWEYCAAPYDYMVSGVNGSDQHTFRTTGKSLESMKLAYYDHESANGIDGPHFYVHFSRYIEDFNLFCGICMFLSDDYEAKKLSKIIVHCDFSEID